jgi:hypothetical protein
MDRPIGVAGPQRRIPPGADREHRLGEQDHGTPQWHRDVTEVRLPTSCPTRMMTRPTLRRSASDGPVGDASDAGHLRFVRPILTQCQIDAEAGGVVSSDPTLNQPVPEWTVGAKQ